METLRRYLEINLELREDCLRHICNLRIGYTCAVVQTMIVCEVSKLDMKKWYILEHFQEQLYVVLDLNPSFYICCTIYV